MTGTITALTDAHVTIGGVSYAYDPLLRWLLAECLERDEEVEAVIVGGRVKEIGRAKGAA